MRSGWRLPLSPPAAVSLSLSCLAPPPLPPQGRSSPGLAPKIHDFKLYIGMLFFGGGSLNSMFIWVRYLGITAPCCQEPAPSAVSSPGMEQAASIHNPCGLCPCHRPALPQRCPSHLCWALSGSTLFRQVQACPCSPEYSTLEMGPCSQLCCH